MAMPAVYEEINCRLRYFLSSLVYYFGTFPTVGAGGTTVLEMQLTWDRTKRVLYAIEFW